MSIIRQHIKAVLYAFFIVLFSFFAIFALKRYDLFPVYWYLSLLPAILMTGYVVWYEKKQRQTHIAFGIIFFLCGLLYLFSVPMLQVSDETVHYLRCYEIAVGQSPITVSDNSVGDLLPANLIPDQFSDPAHTNYAQLADALDEVIDRNHLQEYAFTGAALYSPFTYLPQVLGIFFANLVTDHALILMYAGRLSTLLVVTVLVAMAIKLFPFSKQLPILLLLIPIYVHKTGSMSADGFTLAIIILFLSYILHLQYTTTGVLTARQISIIYLLIFFLSQCKIVYLPVCLFFFVLSPNRFGTMRRYVIHLTALVAVALISGLGWLLISSSYLSIGYSTSAEQIRSILTDPVNYVCILVNTFIKQGPVLVGQMMGLGMGVGGVRNSRLLTYGYLFVLLLSAVFLRRGKHDIQQTRDIWLSLLSAAGVIILTCTALYIQWTPPNESEIWGLQGRYFIPVLFFFCIALMQITSLERIRKPISESFTLLFAFGVNLVAAVSCLAYGITL